MRVRAFHSILRPFLFSSVVGLSLCVFFWRNGYTGMEIEMKKGQPNLRHPRWHKSLWTLERSISIWGFEGGGCSKVPIPSYDESLFNQSLTSNVIKSFQTSCNVPPSLVKVFREKDSLNNQVHGPAFFYKYRYQRRFFKSQIALLVHKKLRPRFQVETWEEIINGVHARIWGQSRLQRRKASFDFQPCTWILQMLLWWPVHPVPWLMEKWISKRTSARFILS